ncbi:DUF418 domain-containing protein [Viridibacillus sp. FSL R5-0888]|uniref:DUF418 domain-containing protein n=1 Tax=unclassified Viridibacillus TaxID=2617942 RepID=UPI00096E8E63|nr:hypothetical protein BK130_11965 [Viridibacillus sp. FSL H8-0123]OMC86167.1 hypothetical protein BK128_11685 [Viridibacillus sp. FSL H7-0596]
MGYVSKTIRRITGLDFARSLAMFGMFIVNFTVITGAGTNGPDWLVHLTALFEGRASALFVLLAGIGIALMTRKAREGNNDQLIGDMRIVIWKRALFLFIVGLGLYLVGWTGDILHYYGVYLFFIAFLISFQQKILLYIVLAVVTIAQILQLTFDVFVGWNPYALYMDYMDFWTINGFLRNLFFNGYHPIFPWFAFILVGFVIGSFDLQSNRIRRKLLIVGVIILVFSEALSKILIAQTASILTTEVAEFLFNTGPILPSILYIISTSGSAFIILIISLYITERFSKSKLVTSIIASGQMTLTHYIAHILIGVSFLEWIGRAEHQSLFFIYSFCIVFYFLCILFSGLWKRKYSRGPAEWLMRYLTK